MFNSVQFANLLYIFDTLCLAVGASPLWHTIIDTTTTQRNLSLLCHLTRLNRRLAIDDRDDSTLAHLALYGLTLNKHGVIW